MTATYNLSARNCPCQVDGKWRFGWNVSNDIIVKALLSLCVMLVFVTSLCVHSWPMPKFWKLNQHQNLKICWSFMTSCNNLFFYVGKYLSFVIFSPNCVSVSAPSTYRSAFNFEYNDIVLRTWFNLILVKNFLAQSLISPIIYQLLQIRCTDSIRVEKSFFSIFTF